MEGKNYGLCKRYPPLVDDNLVPHHPMIPGHEWCGEWDGGEYVGLNYPSDSVSDTAPAA